jgi:hypothetical protein
MYDQKPIKGYQNEGFIGYGLIIPLIEFINKNEIKYRDPKSYPSFEHTKWCFFPHCFRFPEYQHILDKDHMKGFKELYNICDDIFKFIEDKFKELIIIAAEINIMPPCTSLKKHVDTKYWHLMNSKRIHVVLETNEMCFFIINDQEINFKTGEIFEFNNSIPHAVKNNSTMFKRTHLVVDLIPLQYKELFDIKLKNSEAHIYHWKNCRPKKISSFVDNVI